MILSIWQCKNVCITFARFSTIKCVVNIIHNGINHFRRTKKNLSLWTKNSIIANVLVFLPLLVLCYLYLYKDIETSRVLVSPNILNQLIGLRETSYYLLELFPYLTVSILLIFIIVTTVILLFKTNTDKFQKKNADIRI